MPNRILKLQTVKKNPITFLALGNSLSYQDRNGSGTLTASGALRYQPGNGGRVNLIRNPSMETSNTWFGGSMTTSYATDRAIYGVQSLKAVATAATGTIRVVAGFGSSSCAVVPGQAYTGSIYVYNANATARDIYVRHEWTNLDGTAGLGSSSGAVTTCLPGVWTRLSATATAAAGATRCAFQALFSTSTNPVQIGDTFSFDGALYEAGNELLDYFDGTAPGCAWADPITGLAGTAHASPSISKAAFWVEEATTNLLTNPSAEVDVTTGIQFSGGVTGTRDTTYAYLGAASVKSVTPATGGAGVVFNTNSALNYTGSPLAFTSQVRVRGSGSVSVNLTVIYTDATNTVGASTTKVLADSWDQVIPASVTTDPAKTVNFIQLAIRNTAAVAQTFWCDAAQVEQKPYATSYCDGSLGTGYTWAGTAHASASTRATSNLRVSYSSNVMSTINGSVVTQVRPTSMGINNRSIVNVGQWNLDDKDYLSLHHNGSAARFNGEINGTGTTVLSVGSSISVEAVTDLYAGWDSANLYFSANSSVAQSTPRIITPTGQVPAGQPNINFGLDPAGSGLLGLIGPIAFFDRPLTQAEVTKLQNTDPRYWWNLLGP